MEKIMLIINAHRPDISSIDFACSIAKMCNTKLTGLFIENLFFDYIPSDRLNNTSYFKNDLDSSVIVTADTDQSIKLFNDECLIKGVQTEVYIDKGEPMQEVITESRFADLLIVDPDSNFYDREDQLPSHFVKEILAKAECPVILAPDSFNSIDEIVFCYDGSASSVFAIKQFTYLLPELATKKVTLLEINKSGAEEFNDGYRRMMNWLNAHYASVYYQSLKGNVKDELAMHFFMKQQKILVMGAYGRTILSNFFKQSSADKLIRTVDLPLFITHH